MKRECLSLLVAGFIILQFGVGRACAQDRTHEIGVQAYLYAYPMILMEVTRRVSTNVEAPVGVRAPMNQFVHLRAFPDHAFREVVRPNADTLYSIVWFDVSKEPQVLSVADTGGRYYMLPMMDMWTDIIAAPGSRTSGTQAANYAIVGPEWNGTLPDGVEPVRTPTNTGWIIGRTQTNGAADYENVHRIQDGYKLTPLSRWGKAYSPPSQSPMKPSKSPMKPSKSPVKPSTSPVNSTWDMKTPPPVQVASMSAETYFELFATLLKDNPPHEFDWNMVEQIKQIGIIPGEDFDFSRLPPETQSALERATGDAKKMLTDKIERGGKLVNGWQIFLEGMGNYGTSYLQRATVALVGLGALVPEDAVYPMSFADGEGKPYHGQHRYVLHFGKNEIPPIDAFWSLTMYDSDGYFVENPINRYAIGDRDSLEFNRDGSLDIHIQHDSPGEEKESNWLPAPADRFNLVIRLYWPRMEILTGAWDPPAIRRVD